MVECGFILKPSAHTNSARTVKTGLDNRKAAQDSLTQQPLLTTRWFQAGCHTCSLHLKTALYPLVMLPATSMSKPANELSRKFTGCLISHVLVRQQSLLLRLSLKHYKVNYGWSSLYPVNFYQSNTKQSLSKASYHQQA